MTRHLLTLFLVAATLLLHAQDYTIDVVNNEFPPATLTITAGETVQWNNQQGFHNVNGEQDTYPDNPEGFGNGNASSAMWSYDFTFTEPGVYEYQCDPHVGLGMVGTITVQAAGGGPEDLVINEIFYNVPGSDDNYEFVEIFNAGTTAVDLTDFSFTGFDFTFPTYSLAAGGYVVVGSNATALTNDFGLDAANVFERTGGALGNGGELLQLLDANGNVLDEVNYDDEGGWPNAADGNGPSLILCDPATDNNDPTNWLVSTTATGVLGSDGAEIFASPLAANNCPAGAIISFVGGSASVDETAGTVTMEVSFTNNNSGATTVDLIVTGGTATVGTDFTAPATVSTDGGNNPDVVTVTVNIIDDAENEGPETVVFSLANPTNGGTVQAGGGEFTLTILDDDVVQTGALLISGIYDAQPAGAGAKGIELRALEDIPDLGVFGVSSANNGGGATGSPEFTFPGGVSVTAGDCIYVAADSTLFNDFFGFDATYIDGVANINGDDAIELFENGVVIDVFGDVDVDGSGEPWEYTDGWAYRNSSTGPDGDTFVPANWTYSGVDALDGPTTNLDADNPFPVCSYNTQPPQVYLAVDDAVDTDVNTPVTIDVTSNDTQPTVGTVNDIAVLNGATNGSVEADATVLGLFTYTPDTDFCGTDSFDYEVSFTNGNGETTLDTATVSIEVNCPANFSDIADVTQNNADGTAASLGETVEIRGVVYGVDLQGNDNVQFTIIDQTGGIGLFSTNDFGYTVNETDSVIVIGEISQFNGLTQINPDTIILAGTNSELRAPTVVDMLGEDTESELVRLQGVTVTEVNNGGSGNNYTVTDGANTFVVRVDADVDAATNDLLVQAFDNMLTINITGIGGQFDNSAPFDEGYQLLPRYAGDIALVINTQNVDWSAHIRVFPNPASDLLFVRSTVDFEEITLSNALGQPVARYAAGTVRIPVTDRTPGVYYLTFRTETEAWTTRVVVR